MQILEIPAQRKFVSTKCHTHSNGHKPLKSVSIFIKFFSNAPFYKKLL